MTQVRQRSKRKRNTLLQSEPVSKIQRLPHDDNNANNIAQSLISKINGPMVSSSEANANGNDTITAHHNESNDPKPSSVDVAAANDLLVSVHLIDDLNRQPVTRSQHVEGQQLMAQSEIDSQVTTSAANKEFKELENDDAISFAKMFNDPNETVQQDKQEQSSFIVKETTKKPKTRNYKQVQDAAISKAESAKYRKTQKYCYEKETELFSNIPLSELRTRLLTKAFTRCNWAVRECKYSPKVLRLNEKKKRWPNPWETCSLSHLATLPSQQECPEICRIRFKGCSSPYCMSYADDKKTRVMHGPNPCSASLDVSIYNTQPATCTVRVQGEHHLNYFPDVQAMQLTKIVRAVVGDEVICKTSTRDGYQQLQDKSEAVEYVHGEDETFLISKRLYSQLRSDLNRKIEGSYEDDYATTLKFLYNEVKNHTEIEFVESICGVSITSMSLNNFALIMYNKKVVKDNVEVLKKKVSCDSNYKLVQLQVRPREHVKVEVKDGNGDGNGNGDADVEEKKKNSHLEQSVLTFISIETASRNPLVAFAMISSNFNTITMRWLYKAVEHVILQFLPASEQDFELRPLWMIDKGSVELAFMATCNQFFIICKFHAIKAWATWLSKNVLDETAAANATAYFYQFYNCNTKDLYIRVYNRFKEDKEIPNNFKNYYDTNWHSEVYVINDKEIPFYYFWTSIIRESSFGSNGTDNISEIQFAVFSRMAKRSYKPFINRLHIAAQFLVRFLKENRMKTRWKHEADIPEIVNMRNMMKDYKKYNVEAEEGVGKFICINSEVDESLTRNVDLFHMMCTCKMFVYSGRPCPHIYACIFYLAKQNDWKVHSNQPFNLLYLTHLWYHDKESFNTCKEQCNLAYPLVGPSRAKNIEAADNVETLEEDEYEIEKVVGMRLGPNNVPEIFCKWKGYSVSDNCWAAYSNSSVQIASAFFMDFCDWFKRTYNCSVKDDSSVANVLPICALVYSNNNYKADFGENSSAVADHSTKLAMANRKQLTAFFKHFSFQVY